MKEIKSVRVRMNGIDTGSLDIKVIIYSDEHTFSADERVIVGMNNDNPIWLSTRYKKKGLYKDFTEDQFIADYITMSSKIDGAGKTYSIIQDPWEDKVPKWRSYGFDPYYLNNGAMIYIPWNDNNKIVGGKLYSDSDGNELPLTNTYIDKSVKIISDNEEKVMTLGKRGIFEYSLDSQVFVGTMIDQNIIKLVISVWKSSVPNYDELELCSPNNESCSIIPYKSPLKPIEPEVPIIKVSTNEAPKEKMTVVLPPEVIKVKNDITSFMVYIGKVKEKVLLSNPSTEAEEDEIIYDDSPGIDEYTESEFIGSDEAKWEPLKDVADDTFDPDTDKGSGGDEVQSAESFVPATNTQKDFIKSAVKATLSKGEAHGKCARFTFNHANNYVRLMQGKSVQQGTTHAAGGNANGSGYHNNLENIGYKKHDYGNISKSDIISKVSSGNWAVGDVITYWCTDGSSGESHVKYGHTQIFTNGHHNGTSYRWSTDTENNFKCAFVYRRKSGNTYRLIHFQAPKTKKLNDVA